MTFRGIECDECHGTLIHGWGHTPECSKGYVRMADDLAELRALFDLRWNADMRAIKRWQEAHPDRKHVWPDHADMVVWLLEQLDGF